MRSIQDYITRRGRIMKIVSLDAYPDSEQPAGLKEFTGILDAAVAAASTEDPAQYGSHFYKLCELLFEYFRALFFLDLFCENF